MKCWTATAYACVACRTMEENRLPITEENMEMILGILYDFYTNKEIPMT